jgi:hypothetical protein
MLVQWLISRHISGLTKALEVQLSLEQVVEQVAVLACIAVIKLIVRAHDRSYTSFHSICERPVK